MERHLPEMYRHYKGDYYLLIRIALHHESGEEWAVYRPVNGDESVLYVRPLDEFDELVPSALIANVFEKEREPRFRVVTPEEGEQVAINRLREQLERAREEAGDDPQAAMVLGLTEHMIAKVQENLRSGRADAD